MHDSIIVSNYELDAPLTGFESWPDHLSSFHHSRLIKMQKIFVTLGIACFALAGGMSADLISSSISVDGSSWIKSSLTGDKTYSGLLFTNDQSTVTRTFNFSKDLDTHTRISSTDQGSRSILHRPELRSMRSDDACLPGQVMRPTGRMRSRPGEFWHQGIILQSGVCQRI